MSLRGRTAACRSLGYRTYHKYLDGGFWRALRNRVLARDGWRCRLCDGKAQQVHHLDYSKKTMLGKSLDGLVSLCRDCHERLEFGSDGKKLRHREVRSIWTQTMIEKDTAEVESHMRSIVGRW